MLKKLKIYLILSIIAVFILPYSLAIAADSVIVWQDNTKPVIEQETKTVDELSGNFLNLESGARSFNGNEFSVNFYMNIIFTKN